MERLGRPKNLRGSQPLGKGVVERWLEGPMAMPSAKPVGAKAGWLIDRRRSTGRASLMKFSSTNPIGGKNRTFFSTNPFGGKKVKKIGHGSATPSEGTRAFNQPFRLKPVATRRKSSKTRKRRYEHGKRIRRPSACIKHPFYWGVREAIFLGFKNIFLSLPLKL